jgi:hypothetical protein
MSFLGYTLFHEFHVTTRPGSLPGDTLALMHHSLLVKINELVILVFYYHLVL